MVVVGVLKVVKDATFICLNMAIRSTFSAEKDNDEDKPNTKRNHANDPLEVPIRPIMS